MNKKLIAIIVMVVVVFSTVIVTIFGAKAASAEFNIKVTGIEVKGHFAGEVDALLTHNQTITIPKDAEFFQFSCKVIPNDATHKDVTYSSSNSEFISVDASGLVTFRSTSKTADITITNPDSGIKVVIKFVKSGTGSGTIPGW